MILLDTHVLVWWVADPNKLSKKAQGVIKKAIRKRRLYISAISIWEIAMLVEKRRLELTMDVDTWIDKVLSLPGLICIPVDSEIALKSVLLLNNFHKDPADRMIVVTAMHLGVKVITSDKRILGFNEIESVW